MLQLRIRACHVHGRFVAERQPAPRASLLQRCARRARGATRPHRAAAGELPARAGEDQGALAGGACSYIEEHGLNEFFAEGADDIGIIVQGGNYNTLVRALERLGLADVYGRAQRAAVRDERRLSAGRRASCCAFAPASARCCWSRKASPTSSSRTSATILRQADLQTDAARQGHAAAGRRIHRRRSAARARARSSSATAGSSRQPRPRAAAAR